MIIEKNIAMEFYNDDENYYKVIGFIKNIDDIEILQELIIDIIDHNYDDNVELYIYENYLKE